MKYLIRRFNLVFFALYTLNSTLASNITSLYLDFDISMDVKSPEYEKKFGNGHTQSKLQLLRKLYENNNIKPLPNGIPKIIHQIWVGHKPLPPFYKKLQESWIKEHPTWQYKLWTDIEVSALKLHNQKYYDQTNDPIEKANILRLELLNLFGGLYVDLDFECLRSFEPFHNCYYFYTGICPSDTPQIVSNALIASIPGHPIIKHCVESIKDHMHKGHRFDRNGVTFFSNTFLTQVQQFYENTIAFPLGFFYPLKYTYDKTQPNQCNTEKSFAIHYWGWTIKQKIELYQAVNKHTKRCQDFDAEGALSD